MKRSRLIVLTFVLSIGLAACTQSKQTPPTSPIPSTEISSQTRIFTDDAGREITIPDKIEKIAHTGSMAQIFLYTCEPDMMVANAVQYPEEAKKYIKERNASLPVVGQYYGKNANLNLEKLISLSPDIIIDIGEKKPGLREDMDLLQKQIGIPIVFIEHTLESAANTYKRLAELLEKDNGYADQIAYCEKNLNFAKENAKNIKDRKKIYIAMGKKGLNTNSKGSMHSEIMDLVGADNVADIEPASTGAGSEVSFEQVLIWQPEVIIADSKAVYDEITTNDLWKDIKAVKNNEVYQIPNLPYSIISTPPCVNRICGIVWLGNLLYPEIYNMDVSEEMGQFYRLFYHYQ